MGLKCYPELCLAGYSLMDLAIALISIGTNKCMLQVTMLQYDIIFCFFCTNVRITSDYESCKSVWGTCVAHAYHIRTSKRHIYLVPRPIFQNISRNILHFPIFFFEEFISYPLSPIAIHDEKKRSQSV